jgi:hypothetical protein
MLRVKDGGAAPAHADLGCIGVWGAYAFGSDGRKLPGCCWEGREMKARAEGRQGLHIDMGVQARRILTTCSACCICADAFCA